MSRHSRFVSSAVMIVLLALGALCSRAQEKPAGDVGGVPRIEGIWLGTLDIIISRFRLVFHIEEVNGALAAQMDSPDQAVMGAPVPAVSFSENTLVLDLGDGSGRFEGQFDPASNTISGQWMLNGSAYPLLLERVNEAPGIPEPPATRDADYIYSKKDGVALTMDVLTPPNPNGVGIIWLVSGGWFSSHEAMQSYYFPFQLKSLFDRGYTVFAVVHGSQPKFDVLEIADQVDRAVRFIRYHASDYGIDPNRIGISGGSAGGQLALLQGVAGDQGDPQAKDPVERVSSRVQAVACLFPVTDFLNYSKPGEVALGRGLLEDFRGAFNFHAYDEATRSLVPITDEEQLKKIGRHISPIYHVTPDDPPVFIIHGDADTLVPLSQSQSFIAKLEQAGVPAKLMVKPGAGHGWPNLFDDMTQLADWFDLHLRPEIAPEPPKK